MNIHASINEINLICFLIAAQVKHFAQREIEMQKQKKEREDRKAKYVKEAGGLKYTAIAMANRS